MYVTRRYHLRAYPLHLISAENATKKNKKTSGLRLVILFCHGHPSLVFAIQVVIKTIVQPLYSMDNLKQLIHKR